ncbi:MAG: hypothetical protein ACM336_17665 [Acidobacteriota bacterium]
MNTKEIDGLLQRPKLYYNIDGVGELGMGFLFLSYVLLAWLQARSPVWRETWVFIIYWGLMCATIHYGSKAIKNRITYRRTGFVDYRPSYKRWFPMAMSAGVAALMGAGLVLASRRHWDLSSPVSLFGLFFAAVYVRIARTARWKWLALFAIAAGSLTIAALPADLLEAFANYTRMGPVSARAIGAYMLTFAVIGAVLMISGAISFRLYLRHTQPPAEEGS